jgi:uncharacterized membrane protein SpoIIM required for sporulation
MVDVVLRRGLKALGPDELRRLPVLYRSALSSLAVARKTALDRALVSYLEGLSSRAYLAVYGSRRASRGALLTFFIDTFPRAVRAIGRELGLATFIFALGLAVAWALVVHDPEWFYAFVSPGMAQGRTPAAETAELRSALYDGGNGLSVFASFLFTHNARIGMMAFAVGFAAGVPSALLLFLNGLTLGAFLSLYADRGLLVPLLGWLLPHGVPEITAMLLCGAAGLSLGRAVVFPGDRRVRDAMKAAGQRAALVVAGAVVLFAVAGLIEGIFRQVVQVDAVRFAVAAFNTIWVVAWLFVAGRSFLRARGSP